ncbi:hypothetical protein TIFTF001_005472, partial [Ficus carica]|jgi:hypothetical protein
MVEG